MTNLFKFLIFLILFSSQALPQNISRLKAKNEREISKRAKQQEVKDTEEVSSADSLSISIVNEGPPDSVNANMAEEIRVDSLAIKKINKSPKTTKKMVVVPKVKLSINTIPEKVEISLDGNILGKTPIVGGKISSGGHTFEIQKDGYAPITYELNVNPSKSINLDFFMNPVYKIKFKTNEVGLIFELNDTHRWTENTIAMQLEAGGHHLRVYKLGEIVDEQVIVADQPLTFQYYLKTGTVSQPSR